MALHQAVERDQHVHRALFAARHLVEQRLQLRPDRRQTAERCELLLEQRVVAERPGLGVRLQEEVERVDRHHVGHQIDRDVEMRDALGEHHAGKVIALRILLPVDEMRLAARLAAHTTGPVSVRAAPAADGSSAARG